MVTLVSSEGKMTVRPLSVLVQLIKQDIERGNEASRAAGLPHYRAAGEKMLEAKAQLPHGEFTGWIRRHFNLGGRAARLYMSLAHATKDIEKGTAIPPEQRDITFQEAIRKHTKNVNFGKPAAWRAEIDDSVRRVLDSAKRLEKENLTRQQERAAEKNLALQLISIGFKALASKLHPDKGGTKDAMMRLNRVRDRLKAHA